LAYLPSFQSPFIFDDLVNILENPTIQSLRSLSVIFHPPPEAGLVGRPLVNLTLALNYAWSGTDTWSYHVVNFVVHVGATMLVWGLLHELMIHHDTQLDGVSSVQHWLPWICALLWGLHPLNTQAVAYVIQRCESLMGLFYLAALYAYVRGWRSSRPWNWQGLGLVAFLACLGCKEVAVTLLPVALVMVWTIRGENPVKALRRTPLFFGGLLLSLGLLGLGMIQGRGYSTHANKLLSTGAVYTVAQGPILLRYLRLAFWPSDLTLDYGWPMNLSVSTWVGAFLVLALLLGSTWLVVRRHWVGLSGAWFFLILAPTSLIPLPDPIFEHRMYLPLLAVVVLTTLGVFAMLARMSESSVFAKGILLGFLALSLPLGWRTYRRNQDYRTALSIWSDTARKRPNNFRAYHGVAGALMEQGQWAASLPYLQKAAALNPLSFSVRNDTGIALIRLKRSQEAIPELQLAVSILPTSPKAHNNLGVAFLTSGQAEEAIPEFERALQLKPNYLSPRRNLDLALANRKPPQ